MANEMKIRNGLIVIGSGSLPILDIQGSQGELFSVTDQLTGSIHSVNDISGIPILEIFSDDRVNIGNYNNPAIKVSGSTSFLTGSLTGSFTGAGLLVPYTFGGTGISTSGSVTPYIRIMNNVRTINASILLKSPSSGSGFGVFITRSTDSGSSFPTRIMDFSLNSGSRMFESASVVTLTAGDVIRAEISKNSGGNDFTFQINSQTN